MGDVQQIIGYGEPADIVKDSIFLLKSKKILAGSDIAVYLTEKGNYIMSRYIEDLQNDGAEKHGFKTNLK